MVKFSAPLRVEKLAWAISIPTFSWLVVDEEKVVSKFWVNLCSVRLFWVERTNHWNFHCCPFAGKNRHPRNRVTTIARWWSDCQVLDITWGLITLLAFLFFFAIF